MESEQWTTDMVLRLALTQWNNWKSRENRLHGPLRHNQNASFECWTPPPTDFLKCNVNATIFLDSGKVSFGAVLRSNNSNIVASLSGPVGCIHDPYHVEALACKEALSWIKNRGDRNVIVETDCLNL